MKHHLCGLLGILLAALVLSSCAPFKTSDRKANYCNELNSKIIFNAATSNTRRAEIESAEEPLQQRSYYKNNCDQR